MTNANSNKTLSALLFALSVVVGIVAIVVIFAPTWLLSLPLGGEVPPSGAFEQAIMGGIGVLALALAYLLNIAARDPVRYAAVVDALIVMLVAAALFNLYLALTHRLDAYYPATLLFVRVGVQLILVAVFFRLRPKAAVDIMPPSS